MHGERDFDERDLDGGQEASFRDLVEVEAEGEEVHEQPSQPSSPPAATTTPTTEPRAQRHPPQTVRSMRHMARLAQSLLHGAPPVERSLTPRARQRGVVLLVVVDPRTGQKIVHR